MTTRRAVRSQPKPEPLNPRVEKAKHLPMPGPLHLLPEYLALYRLQPAGIQEPQVQPKDGPGEAILLVKRVPPESK